LTQYRIVTDSRTDTQRYLSTANTARVKLWFWAAVAAYCWL